MIILLFLIPLSVLAASGFLAAFIWAVRAGQYDDTCTPALRPLMEDQSQSAPENLPDAQSGPNDAAQPESKNWKTLGK